MKEQSLIEKSRMISYLSKILTPIFASTNWANLLCAIKDEQGDCFAQELFEYNLAVIHSSWKFFYY